MLTFLMFEKLGNPKHEIYRQYQLFKPPENDPFNGKRGQIYSMDTTLNETFDSGSFIDLNTSTSPFDLSSFKTFELQGVWLDDNKCETTRTGTSSIGYRKRKIEINIYF